MRGGERRPPGAAADHRDLTALPRPAGSRSRRAPPQVGAVLEDDEGRTERGGEPDRARGAEERGHDGERRRRQRSSRPRRSGLPRATNAKTRASRGRPPREPGEEGAGARGHTLAALEAEPHRETCGRARPRSRPRRGSTCVARREPDRRTSRPRALRGVEEEGEDPGGLARGAHDVGCAHVAAADLAHVAHAEDPRHEIAERDGAEQVATASTGGSGAWRRAESTVRLRCPSAQLRASAVYTAPPAAGSLRKRASVSRRRPRGRPPAATGGRVRSRQRPRVRWARKGRCSGAKPRPRPRLLAGAWRAEDGPARADAEPQHAGTAAVGEDAETGDGRGRRRTGGGGCASVVPSRSICAGELSPRKRRVRWMPSARTQRSPANAGRRSAARAESRGEAPRPAPAPRRRGRARRPGAHRGAIPRSPRRSISSAAWVA